MKIKKGFLLKDSESKTIVVDYTPISECPNCKKALAPQNLFGIVHEKDNDKKSIICRRLLQWMQYLNC